MVAELREQARESQLSGLKKGSEIPVSPDLGGREPKGKIAKALAEKAGIGRSSMEYLMAVQRDAPDLFEKVKSGEMSINKIFTYLYPSC